MRSDFSLNNNKCAEVACIAIKLERQESGSDSDRRQNGNVAVGETGNLAR